MKIKLSVLTLLFVLLFSVSIFAGDDGTTHSGGKSCPTGTTCLIDEPEFGTTEEPNIFTEFFDYLSSLIR